MSELLLAPGERADVLVQAGRTCHILEHEDIGMMGMWHVGDGGMEM